MRRGCPCRSADLKIAAKEAEFKNADRVTVEEIRAATKCSRKCRLSYLLGKLNEDQRQIYQILKERRSVESGQLYAELCTWA